MVLFRSFFDHLPKSIEESAWMDEATPFTVFSRLIFPMSMPVFAAVTLFIGVYHWNDWFQGLFYVRREELRPLQTMLQMLISRVDMLDRLADSGADLNEVAADAGSVTKLAVRSAVVVITVTPIIMIYPFLQRYMVKGIMLGAIKG